jgi:hypothetical protein
MSDEYFTKSEYYDDGVRFGTGTELIAEVKRLRSELESSRGRVAELEAKDKKIAELEEREDLCGYWFMFDELVGKGWSAIRANAFTVAKATFDLTQQGFFKDARIAELEAELDREKKLHRQANAMRLQQMDRDSARIAELTLEADRHVEEITHLRNEGKQNA